MFRSTPHLSISYRHDKMESPNAFVLTDGNGRDFRVVSFTVFEDGGVRAEGPGYRANGQGMTSIYRHTTGDINLLPTHIRDLVRDDFRKYGVVF